MTPLVYLHGWQNLKSQLYSVEWVNGSTLKDLKNITQSFNKNNEAHNSNDEIIQIDYETNCLLDPELNNLKKKMPFFSKGLLNKIDLKKFWKNNKYDLILNDNLFSKKNHKKNICKAKEHILNGDIFQINLCRLITGSFTGCPRTLALEMFKFHNPKYGCYLEQRKKNGWRIIISLSPECFFKANFKKNLIYTYPMKGTLGINKPKHILINSKKDLAELNMITDLMRNDLGRISIPNGVKVINERKVEKHSTVWQTISEIKAELQKGLTSNQIITSLFPAGSITGAPKIQAMKLIDKLENFSRGPYTGSVIVNSKNNDTLASVLIRTLVLNLDSLGPKAKGSAEYGVGGGITLQSNPEDEWNETISKAKVLEPFASNSWSLHN